MDTHWGGAGKEGRLKGVAGEALHLATEQRRPKPDS